MPNATPCGAKTRAGGTCKKPAMKNGRCRYHGGKSPPPGPGHHSYTHGRTSKLYRVPARMAPRFEAAMNDPELTDTTRDLALIQTLIDDQLGQLEDGDPIATLRRIRDHWEAIEAERAKVERDVDLIRSEMEAMGKAIMGIRRDYPTHRDLIAHAKSRAGLAEKHQTMMLDRELLMTAAQVRDMLQRTHERFDSIIQRYVPSHVNDARRELGESIRTIILGLAGREVRAHDPIEAEGGSAVVVAGDAERSPE